jgi:hypothetical protein
MTMKSLRHVQRMSTEAAETFTLIYKLYNQSDIHQSSALRFDSISIGGLVVKLAVAIYLRSIRLAPGSIPGRCKVSFLLLSAR